MYHFILRTLIFLVFPLVAPAQEFNYVQYDTKEGLAGSTVYDMCQDSDGFMWFATNNGLSRFDGTNFKNYTVKDGLPDNEVLRIFADSRGRIWIGTFSKEICFYFRGAIYNNQNCNWLNKIALRSAAVTMCEDEKGIIIISDLINLFEINIKNQVNNLIDHPSLQGYKGIQIYAATNFFDGGFFICIPGTFFKFKNYQLKLFNHPKKNLDKYVVLKGYANGDMVETLAPDSRINQTSYKHTAIFVSTSNGAWSIDTVQYKFKTHFLPGKKISHTINDREGNIWFSTLGNGVYRLPSLEMRNIEFPSKIDIADKEVFSLGLKGNDIYCGLGFSKIAVINDNKITEIRDYSNIASTSSNNSLVNKLTAIRVLSNGATILGSDAFLLNMETGNHLNKNIVAVKSVAEINKQQILVGNFNKAYKLAAGDLHIIDTIFHGRSTKVFYNNHKYYIGTLNGLYEISENKQSVFLGDLHPILKRRITDIVATKDNTIWVATNDAGVVAYKNGRIISAIQEVNGLSSNICKSLYLNQHYLFVGTNKGLNKINLENPRSPILKYSASDGLPSDIVNKVLVKDSMVYVGSPRGLTFFNEHAVANNAECNLKLLKVNVSGKNYELSNNYSLSYKNNNIEFEYVAVSFKSGGDILYHYMLAGLDSGWKTTRETNLIYQTLPSGNYTLQLYAENKFGVKSHTTTIGFSISTPFWRTWWAYLIGLLFIIGVTGFLFNIRSKEIQRRLVEKNKFQKQFAELEQQALQAQMNPHFIFNCLNSIQQYILTNDRERANKYLTNFATLIRQTLYISGKKSVKVSEEVHFLTEYLEMEKMRFGDSFIYEIIVDEDLDVDFIEIPALLLQPYVENSLRHGIRYKVDGRGKAMISFNLRNEMLVCRISDNGIGRAKARLYKNNQHIEYQSKGMNLTEKRVNLLNSINDRKISIEIIDHVNDFGTGIGTEVVVQIPV